MIKYLAIAGFVIAIINKKDPGQRFREDYTHNYILNYFSAFQVDQNVPIGKIDFTIILIPRLNSDVILKSTKKNTLQTYLLFYEEIGKRKIVAYQDTGVLQFQLILRRILQRLLTLSTGFIMHGSAVLLNGKGIVFSGKSGAGKSTLVDLLKEEATPLADDMVIIRKVKKDWLLYQTPFFEKSFWFLRNSEAHKLKMILTPKQDEGYKIVLAKSNLEMFELLMTQLFTEKADLPLQIKTLQKLINSKIKMGKIYFGLNRKEVLELLMPHASKA